MLGIIKGRRRRGWQDEIISPIWWTWVWASSECWWWIGKPGVLQSMRSQRVRHGWATELNSMTSSAEQLLMWLFSKYLCPLWWNISSYLFLFSNCILWFVLLKSFMSYYILDWPRSLEKTQANFLANSIFCIWGFVRCNVCKYFLTVCNLCFIFLTVYHVSCREI